MVDVVGMLTGSIDPSAYWRKLKQRMKEEEGAAETVTKCHGLKLTAADGKQRVTDAANTEGVPPVHLLLPTNQGVGAATCCQSSASV